MKIDNPPDFTQIIGGNGNIIRPFLFEIGAWDMTATVTVYVDVSSVGLSNIISMDTMIYKDDGSDNIPIDYSGAENGYISSAGNNLVALFRRTPSNFDNVAYNSILVNRGYLLAWVKV